MRRRRLGGCWALRSPFSLVSSPMPCCSACLKGSMIGHFPPSRISRPSCVTPYCGGLAPFIRRALGPSRFPPATRRLSRPTPKDLATRKPLSMAWAHRECGYGVCHAHIPPRMACGELDIGIFEYELFAVALGVIWRAVLFPCRPIIV